MNKLLEHFKRMQLEASDYLSSSDTHENNVTFINSILEALDGPEQREAQAEAETVGTYIEQALRTESGLEPLRDSMGVSHTVGNRLLHAAMGLTTEAGEFLDALKKHLFYGKPLDLVNLREELGDIMWYLAIACDALGTTFEAEQARNIAKLKARYPDKFTSEAAIERDLEGERKVLEQ